MKTIWLASTALCLLVPAAWAQDEGAAAPFLDAIRNGLHGHGTLSFDSVTGDAADTVISHLRITGPDKAMLGIAELHLLGIGEAPVEGALPTIDRLTLDDLTLEPGAGDDRPGKLSLDSLDISGVDFNTLISTAVVGDPADLATALTIDQLSLAGLALDFTDEDGIEQAIHLADLKLDGLDQGFVKGLHVDGFDVDKKTGEDAGHVAVETLDLTDFNAAPLIAAMATGGPGLTDLFGLDLSSFHLAGVTIDVPDSPNLRIDDFTISDVVRQSDKVIGHHFALSLNVPVAELQDADAQDLFTGIGLTELPITIAYTQGMDPAKKTFSIDGLTIGLAGAGEITGDVHLGNVPVEAYLSGDMSHVSGMDMTLVGLHLGYRDEGLVPKLIDAVAQEQGLDAADMVQAVIAQMRSAVATGEDTDRSTPIIDAIASFLSKPGQLTVSATPAEPLPVSGIVAAAMISPASLFNALDLSVEAH